MSGYTDPFTGSSTQPTNVSYRSVSLTASVALVWPPQSTSATDYVARLMEVTATGAGYSLTMPDATAQSTGFDVIWTNPGANTYTVKANDGSTLLTVAPGQVQYLYLKSSATPAGIWGVFQFGASSSQVAAASLAGPGISAAGGALYSAEVTAQVSANYSVVVGDRTKFFVWTGGVGTITLPASMSAGNDWFTGFANQGTGALTIAASGADTLDGASSQTLLIGESFEVHADGGTAFFSEGRGRSVQFNFTLLSKAVSTGTVTLSNIEAANIVQKYTGALTGNVTVVLPSTVQVYYVSNQTTNAFSLTFKCGAGTTVTVPHGQNAVLFTDGTNTINASTTVSGIASLTLNQGAVGSPSINYSGDITTGFYQPAGGSVAVSILGTEVLRVNATGLGLGIVPSAPFHIASGSNELARFQSSVASGGYAAFNNGSDFLLLLGYGSTLCSTAANTDAVVRYNGTHNLCFSRDGTEVARFDASGRLGIGRTPTTYAVEVNGDVQANNFRGALAGNASSATAASSATVAASVTGQTSANTPSTVVARDTNGDFVMRALTVGNTSVGGNTLDWVERGTFTPALKFGGNSTGMTYSVQAGIFTRICNVVMAHVRIVLTAKGSSTGTATIGGLPYAASATAGAIGSFIQGEFSGMAALGSNAAYGAQGAGGTSALTVVSQDMTGASSGPLGRTDTSFTNLSVIDLHFMYQA